MSAAAQHQDESNPYALRDRISALEAKVEERVGALEAKVEALTGEMRWGFEAQAKRHDAYRHRFNAIDAALQEITAKLQ